MLFVRKNQGALGQNLAGVSHPMPKLFAVGHALELFTELGQDLGTFQPFGIGSLDPGVGQGLCAGAHFGNEGRAGLLDVHTRSAQGFHAAFVRSRPGLHPIRN